MTTETATETATETSATESSATLFEKTIDNMRRATESAFDMQQEMYSNWSKMWPAAVPPKDWTARKDKFKQAWMSATTDLMQKHREALDQKYRAGIESLEEAFRVSESESHTEYRERCETLCRKTLDLMKSSAEAQMEQYQAAMNQWIDVCQTKP